MVDNQKRMMMAIAASFLFLMLWSKYFGPKPAAPTKAAPVSTQSVTTTTELPSSENTSVLDSDTSIEPTPTPEKNIPTIAQETVMVDFDHFDAVIDNRMGAITDITLHAYKKELKKNASGMQIVPIELADLPPMLWDLEIVEGEKTYGFTDQQATYEWIERGENGHYRLRTQVGPVEIEKTYAWDADTYQVKQSLLLVNRSNNRLVIDAHTNMYAAKDPLRKPKTGFLSLFQARQTPTRVVSLFDDKVERFDFAKIAKGNLELPQGAIGWAGFESQYFLMSLMPTVGLWKDIQLYAPDEMHSQIQYNYAQRDIKPQSSVKYEMSLYAGPKDIAVLTSIDDSLKYSIDLGGWLGPISRLILRALRMLYQWLGNYGLAIIILTVFVRLLMFPLAQKQAKSMKKMQDHKPQMDALKEQYADNKEEYSRALMQYMRSNRINPAGGCFPLLIQFPIFIALYRVLYNSIELRHAPFFGWIHDLSAYDPYFVLPALVGITFFFQTKLNPTPISDPTQAAMMKFMPVMFSVLMIFLPSGLNLYIFVSTLWGIVQQYWVQKSKTV
ncbi:MAG: membrane protein insertase YidC [Deltaproteobacteria bacterium]|nr:membrane protein insertase YidC [Deltaproteobacteria bacterium]